MFVEFSLNVIDLHLNLFSSRLSKIKRHYLHNWKPHEEIEEEGKLI